LVGITKEEFPDLLGAPAPKQQPQHRQNKIQFQEKPKIMLKQKKYEKSKSPEKVVEDVKSEFENLEVEIERNKELYIKHKINPNKLVNPKNKKKNKMQSKKEDFPGLPG
jgi:hypothetical protein